MRLPYALMLSAVWSLPLLTAAPSYAQEVKIGMSATITGANAANGVPYRNASEIFPKTLGGVPVRYIVLDDATDPTTAAKNARTFVDEKVDAMLGSTSTAAAAAMMDLANSSGTVQIAMSPVSISEAQRPFVFSIPQPVPVMVSAVLADAKARGFKKIGYMGYNDGWGDLNANALNAGAKTAGIEVVAAERFGRVDTSVTAQALKVIAANPDAVYIGASGTSGVLPQTTLRDQGFTGAVYQTHGSVMKPVIDALGSAGSGTMFPTGPIAVAAGLPDSNPIKAVALDFIAKYDAKWGKGSASPISGYAWDGMKLLDAAVAKAITTAKPGTPEFRLAIRDALNSGMEVVGTNAVYHYTPQDHYGVDDRARVLVVIKDGAFQLVK